MLNSLFQLQTEQQKEQWVRNLGKMYGMSESEINEGYRHLRQQMASQPQPAAVPGIQNITNNMMNQLTEKIMGNLGGKLEACFYILCKMIRKEGEHEYRNTLLVIMQVMGKNHHST